MEDIEEGLYGLTGSYLSVVQKIIDLAKIVEASNLLSNFSFLFLFLPLEEQLIKERL